MNFHFDVFARMGFEEAHQVQEPTSRGGRTTPLRPCPRVVEEIASLDRWRRSATTWRPGGVHARPRCSSPATPSLQTMAELVLG